MTAPAGKLGKAEVYAAFGNPALLRTVRGQLPRGGAVLDVGCASGGLLAALDAEAGHREGIELDPVAAAAARAHADAVHVGPVDEVDVAEAAFDVVVLGDVLEHLPDPHVALERAQRWLRPDGRLVISLPNVAHWTVRLGLLLGRWEYRDRGILDDTHLRFFTWDTGARLVEEAGLVIEGREPVVPGLRSQFGWPAPTSVERVWRGLGRRRPNLFAFQQLIVARTSGT
jgi:SAM-dependent methyltransferase